MSGRRTIADRLRRVREWERVRDDPTPYDVEGGIIGALQSQAVHNLGFTWGTAPASPYALALEMVKVFEAGRRRGGVDPVIAWRRHLDGVTGGLPRERWARAADEMAETLRAEIHGELTALTPAATQLGRDALAATQLALQLSHRWDDVAEVCREGTATVDLDKLTPPNG